MYPKTTEGTIIKESEDGWLNSLPSVFDDLDSAFDNQVLRDVDRIRPFKELTAVSSPKEKAIGKKMYESSDDSTIQSLDESEVDLKPKTTGESALLTVNDP